MALLARLAQASFLKVAQFDEFSPADFVSGTLSRAGVVTVYLTSEEPQVEKRVPVEVFAVPRLQWEAVLQPRQVLVEVDDKAAEELSGHRAARGDRAPHA